MINRISLFASISLLVLNIIVVNMANSADLPEVQVTASPGWVESITFSTVELKDKSEIREGEYFLLFDEQINVLKAKEKYKHFAIKLLNENAITNNSRISIDFAPSYQSLNIHDIVVWRNGKSIHQDVKNKLKLLQREKELENLIYDGRWTATILLDDIRKGDVLEYSYTVKGDNPAYKGNVSEMMRLQWTTPVAKQVYRLLWPDSMPITVTKPNEIKDDIKISSYAGYKEYRIERAHYPTLQIASETPVWFDPWDRVIFSSTSTWEKVANWGIDLYEIESNTGKYIEAIVKEIRASHKNKLEQASAALHYVQDEIRYVGIEVGAGSYVPTKANITLKRRYGDCKDKTYLLLSILKALDIEAYPVLANTDYGENLADDGPRLDAFNHVLVKVNLDDQSFWLETTTNNQASTLDKIFQPDYGQALVLMPGTRSLTSMYQVQPYHKVIFSEVFDLTAGVNKEAFYTIHTTLRGNKAERFRRNLNSKGKKKLVKEYLEYYTKYYNDIESVGDVKISDDNSLNLVTVIEKYRIPNIWSDNKDERRYYANFYNNAIYPYVVKPKVSKRNSPYKITHPVNQEQNITVLLPESWNIETDDDEIKTPFFNYSSNTKHDAKENKLYLNYKFQTLKKYISADQIDDYIKALDDISDNLEYGIYWSYANAAATSTLDESWLTVTNLILIICGFLLLIFIYAYIEFRINQKKSPSAVKSKYYPVSTFKVFILSTATYGGYLVYWFYKNWYYVKHREHSTLIPWGRAFFYSFWLYPLYKSFYRDNAFSNLQQSGSRDFRYSLLAIVFLISTVLMNVDHVLSYLALVIFSACVLPMVEKINQLTIPTDEYYQFNSKWRSRHFVFIVIFMVITLFDISSRINIIPNDTVVPGESLWSRDIKYMHRIGVLSPEDKLVLFYSDAFISFKEDGNGLSNAGVFSYWRDEDTGKVNIEVAKFRDIADVKYIPNKLGTSAIQIKRKDGSHFVLYATNSSKFNLYIDLVRYWKNHKEGKVIKGVRAL